MHAEVQPVGGELTGSSRLIEVAMACSSLASTAGSGSRSTRDPGQTRAGHCRQSWWSRIRGPCSGNRAGLRLTHPRRRASALTRPSRRSRHHDARRETGPSCLPAQPARRTARSRVHAAVIVEPRATGSARAPRESAILRVRAASTGDRSDPDEVGPRLTSRSAATGKKSDRRCQHWYDALHPQFQPACLQGWSTALEQSFLSRWATRDREPRGIVASPSMK